MLIVRCPACHTVFRVRPEQLRAHAGRVRCGSCQGAFNAVEHLMDQERAPEAAALAKGKEAAAGAAGAANAHSPVPPAPAPAPTSPPPASLKPDPLDTADELDFGIPEAAPTTSSEPQPDYAASARDARPQAAPASPVQNSGWPALERNTELSRAEFRPYVPPQPPPQPPDMFVRKSTADRPATDNRQQNWSQGPAWSEPLTEPALLRDEPATLPVDDLAPDDVGDADDAPPEAPDSPPASDADTPSPFVVRDEDPPLANDPDETDDDDTPAFLYHAEPQVKHRWLWGLMTGMLAGTLAVQSAYLFREDIARKWPETRPWYLEMCTHLGCTVPLPRVANAITIESSNLESDPDAPKQFILSARVRNQAPHPQQYPHLELTLTDGRDRPVVRRVITPQEWAQDGALEHGMSARAEIEASVPFEATGPVSAVGYRVYAFYP